MSDADDAYWANVGHSNPYWGVLSHDRFLGSELEPSRMDEFMATGVQDIDYITGMIRQHVDANFAPRAALDFGCGVGRLVAAMARHAQSVTGIDGSEGMLAHAARNAGALGASRVRFLQAIPEESFDWINSLIVFQHIEPRKGIRILDTLLSRLAVGGVVSLHFTIFRDSRVMTRGIKDSRFGRFNGDSFINFDRGESTDMPLYEYDLSEVVCYLTRYNINPLTMTHLDHGGLHGMWIVGARR